MNLFDLLQTTPSSNPITNTVPDPKNKFKLDHEGCLWTERAALEDNEDDCHDSFDLVTSYNRHAYIDRPERYDLLDVMERTEFRRNTWLESQ